MSEDQDARVPTPHPLHPECLSSSPSYTLGFCIRFTNKFKKPIVKKHQSAQDGLDSTGDVNTGLATSDGAAGAEMGCPDAMGPGGRCEEAESRQS